MSCKDCNPRPKTKPQRLKETKPCPECVLEHIRRAEIAVETSKRGDRDRYKGYWHLAQAADLTDNSKLKAQLLATRRQWQLNNTYPDWGRLVDDAIILKDKTNAKY